MNTRLLVLALVICSCGTSAPDPTAFTTTLPDGGQCPAGTRICINSSTGSRCVSYSNPINCGTCGNVCPTNMQCRTSAPFRCE